jgi:hypothetical protein
MADMVAAEKRWGRERNLFFGDQRDCVGFK